jgi:hypothetical protein
MQGACPVEDAEVLLELLLSAPTAALDWREVTRLHTAVLQVIVAAGAVPTGPCGDPLIAEWLPLGAVSG